jgi:hypothetical protein
MVFAAAEYLADPKNGVDGGSVLDHLRQRIIENNGLEPDDHDGLKTAIQAARRSLGATLVALREDALDAFVLNDDGGFANFLSEVSDASRIRSGLSYFDFVFTIASAAGVPHFCVFVDQLEDLATTPTVTKAERSREVGRLRDIIAEIAPFAGNLRFVFTFHIRASSTLDEMWRLNRLPSYDPEDPANEGNLVVLRGIQNVDQARKLLTTYLSSKRADGETDNPSTKTRSPCLSNGPAAAQVFSSSKHTSSLTGLPIKRCRKLTESSRRLSWVPADLVWAWIPAASPTPSMTAKSTTC